MLSPASSFVGGVHVPLHAPQLQQSRYWLCSAAAEKGQARSIRTSAEVRPSNLHKSGVSWKGALGKGARGEGFSIKAASSRESFSGPSSRRAELHDDRDEEPLTEIREEGAVAERATEKADGLEQKQQDCDAGGSSWKDEDRRLLASALDKLEALRLHALALEQWNSSRLINVHRKYQRSAQNLLHYVALESVDLQEVQASLSTLGLASTEGIEAHVLASLTRVIDAAHTLSMVHDSHTQVITGDQFETDMAVKPTRSFDNNLMAGQNTHNKNLNIDTVSTMTIGRSKLELSHNTMALFGPSSSQRKTYIMVTLSEETAENEAVVLDLMKAGMNLVRINCAHGDTEVWGNIIRTVKHCSQMLEQPCRVLMDLAGPKLRTSPFPAGPCVQRIKPHRNGCGKVRLPARVWIALQGTPVPNGILADAVVPVVGNSWLSTLQIGDKLKFKDARGKPRQLTIIDKIMGSAGVGCWAECYDTTYLESGTELELSKKKGRPDKGHVSALPCVEYFIRVKKGDLLVLTKENSLKESDELPQNWIHRVQVSNTFGQLFDSVRPGELIRFDDGRIEGVIRGVAPSEICVEVTFANEKGTKLGGEKSINLPQSNLSPKGLTVKDLIDLDFVVGHADMVGLSFVNSSDDVQILQQALEKRGAMSIGVVLKIETRSGIKKLPEILLQGMRNENPLGVMIARGDLAVECGWESLAGLQEELLRICKAAHIPSIWATQVLEGLAKDGLPTRPEITDAAVGGRAACVMLNKGSYILKAVSVLDSILNRSPVPQRKVYANDQPFGISTFTE